MRWFQISGGEPQLWKDLPGLVRYIGEQYRSKIGQRFEIVTNGTITPSEELLKAMQQYQACMFVDDYDRNYESQPNRIKELLGALEQYGIEYTYNKPDRWVNLGVFEKREGAGDMETWFDRCGMPFHANEYGRIYTCAYGSFAIKAGLIKDEGSETFDLHQDLTDLSKKEFVEFTLGYSEKGYSRLCERCYGWVETVNDHFVPAAVQMGGEE